MRRSAQILQVPVMSSPVWAFEMHYLLTRTLCTAIFKSFRSNQNVQFEHLSCELYHSSVPELCMGFLSMMRK